MFERFGEFDSAKEINETAIGLKNEGDLESLKVLAKENGIDEEVAEVFADGDIPNICDEMSAAIGKIDVERKEIDTAEIFDDWCEYIRDLCSNDKEFAQAVRAKGNSLEACLGEILKWSFRKENQHPVEAGIVKAAGVNASKVTFGVPGMATAKKIIKGYYFGR